MKQIEERSNGVYSNGSHQFIKQSCSFCNKIFFARKDRVGKTKFCSEKCYWTTIENKNTFEISEYQMSIIDGCMLSDACISKSKKAKNYSFSHTSIHKEYSNFIKNELNISLKISSKKSGFQDIMGRKSYCQESFTIKSPNSPTFSQLRNNWYDEIKIVPKNVLLNPISILHWYLGDGYIDSTHGIGLCTQGFSYEDNCFLVESLNKIGFCSTLNKKNEIQIPNKRVYEFLHYIGPSPVECLSYKWNSHITESYLGRKCKGCGTVFDVKQNSRYFCDNSCYQKNWRKNGATIRLKNAI